MPKKKANKGFKRTRKEWEASIAAHIGKAIDSGNAVDYLLNAGLAILGYNTFGGIGGALIGPIALKLALAPGGTPPIAQISGVATLATMGITASGALDYLAKQYEVFWKETTEELKKKTGIPSIPVGEPVVRVIK